MSNMIEFDSPEWVDVELVGETVLGGAPTPSDGRPADSPGVTDAGFGRRASIGRPQTRSLRADDSSLDKPTQEFIAATPGRFYLVRLLCRPRTRRTRTTRKRRGDDRAHRRGRVLVDGSTSAIDKTRWPRHIAGDHRVAYPDAADQGLLGPG